MSQIILARKQDQVVQDIVWLHIISSRWYAHSEAILQTLLCSQDEEERRFGVFKILELRTNKDQGDTTVRPRRTPSLNRNATNLMNMIQWEKSTLYEPFLTCTLYKHGLIELLNNPMVVPYFPCHGQCIERVVKQVTRAAAEVHGEEKRDGFISKSTPQRKLVLVRNTKADLAKMAL